MGKRGPPKKPTDLKILQGIPGGKHKLPKNEIRPPKIKLEKAKPTFKLNTRAKKIFQNAAKLLTELSLITKVDLGALTRYADTFDKWLKAKERIDKEGLTFTVYKEIENADGDLVPVPTYSQQLPEVAIYKSYGQELSRLESQFGMTPSARTGLNVTPPKQENPDSVRSKLFG